MVPLAVQQLHRALRARFTEVNGLQVVETYGDSSAEYHALVDRAGVLDFGFRGRLCLTGADRIRFLHGQVTNDINRLEPGQGCYALVVNAKGRIESDLNVYRLPEELLLDFEPGMAGSLAQRLEKYIVADDVQVVDVAPIYGLLTVQGPKAEAVVRNLAMFDQIPHAPFLSIKRVVSGFGELHLANQPRLRSTGFDLFAPAEALGLLLEKLIESARAERGGPAGWEAFETARVEAGIPRFGVDMDGATFPQECGLETRAMSYSKGCYIGQEVLNRIHTMGHVNRLLRGLRLTGDRADVAAKGDKLFRGTTEVGHVTTVVRSPKLGATISLGYLRKDAWPAGMKLNLRTRSGDVEATVTDLPFQET